MAPTTRGGPNTPINDTNPNNMTPESVQAMIDQALLRNSTNGDGSHSSHGDNRRNVQTARLCFYADFMKCQLLNFKGTEGMVGLTRSRQENSTFDLVQYQKAQEEAKLSIKHHRAGMRSGLLDSNRLNKKEILKNNRYVIYETENAKDVGRIRENSGWRQGD
ncbi:hypothetical protein Tco_0923613 [Tanacetum coccineum]|uniref:Uncharacterized protein n=1 Tax=Tanacetum coccineum TaxID=301880 RepID=A0ABQ5D7Y0_9ASTR